MSEETSGGAIGGEGRGYPLPRVVSVEWRQKSRGERVQHAVGFLVSVGETHLVLSDKFDGKHPVSQRLWTIDLEDVVVLADIRPGGR